MTMLTIQITLMQSMRHPNTMSFEDLRSVTDWQPKAAAEGRRHQVVLPLILVTASTTARVEWRTMESAPQNLTPEKTRDFLHLPEGEHCPLLLIGEGLPKAMAKGP